jgi:hypothetical protein
MLQSRARIGLRLLAMVFAIACQLAFLPAAMAGTPDGPQTVAAQCSVNGNGGNGQQTPAHHGPAHCLHCLSCVSAEGAVAIVPPLPRLSPAWRQAARVIYFTRWQSRAPPSPITAAFPRGPPSA